VIVYGSVKVTSWEGQDRDQEGRFGERDLTTRRSSSRRSILKGSIEIEKSAEKEGDKKRVLADGICTGYASGGRGAEDI